MNLLIAQAAQDFSEMYERREHLRWGLADVCALVEVEHSGLVALAQELAENFGISVTPASLRDYARVAKAFSENHRHLQYKWSNYLAWSKWDDPIKAMEMALDGCLSPRQMDDLRLGKREKKKVCEGCGGDLGEGYIVCERCLNEGRSAHPHEHP